MDTAVLPGGLDVDVVAAECAADHQHGLTRIEKVVLQFRACDCDRRVGAGAGDRGHVRGCQVNGKFA